MSCVPAGFFHVLLPTNHLSSSNRIFMSCCQRTTCHLPARFFMHCCQRTTCHLPARFFMHCCQRTTCRPPAIFSCLAVNEPLVIFQPEIGFPAVYSALVPDSLASGFQRSCPAYVDYPVDVETPAVFPFDDQRHFFPVFRELRYHFNEYLGQIPTPPSIA